MSEKLKIFVFLQVLHITLLILLEGLVPLSYLFVFSGAYSLLNYFRFINGLNRIKLSPITFYLIASFIRLGITTIYFGLVLLKGFEIKFGAISTTEYALGGLIILLVGDLFFIMSFVIFAKPTTHNVKSIGIARISTGLIIYLISALISYANHLGVGLISSLGQLFSLFEVYGMSGGIYLMLRATNNSGGKANLFFKRSIYILAALNIGISMFSYMKSDLFIAVFPLLLYSIEQNYNQLSVRTIFSLSGIKFLIIGYFMVSLITVYSQIRRAQFLYDGAVLKQSVYTIKVVPYLMTASKALIPGTDVFEQYHDFPKSGIWGLFSRLSVPHVAGWAYKEVQENGLRSESFFSELAVVLIPRALWPKKPEISPGRELSVSIGAGKSVKNSSTSTALTMSGAYYWWYGWFGVVLGMFFSGMLLAALWNTVRNIWRYNGIAAVMTISLFFQNFHWNEGDFYGKIPTYLFMIVVYVPLIKLMTIEKRHT